ncbi:Mrp/NBP35 family ATP-binding protein [Wolbachia endosymbiont of Howardula sp.]|uniref:Mrp/NBP35 family ATP-binding protein n=1 Tax=Wolbachia endosymbiont of Howardula sp. TaxID=2916816 RepID=UPI00217EC8E7|nr:Mrp/NBP35 family ATP-binding protein [Wolbachia endosymbiont of Howardula sp.]UWI83096.1 Mrp/NBP35 family ATP-binding protein [Wolbachia endosymbiont of Howardula sp.]
MINKAIIIESLKQIIERKSGQDIIPLGTVTSIIIQEGGVVACVIEMYNTELITEELRHRCQHTIQSIPGVSKATVTIIHHKHIKTQKEKMNISGVKNTIIIASGKGGVGKSTVALNIALSLVRQHYNVAIVDADIYGPSIPKMLDAETLKPTFKENKILPIKKYGLHSMSIGFFLNKDQAVIWRGPMLTKALYKLLLETQWSNIDYLIIDTPPGTGDIHLSLMESFNLTGSIIVSTPQELSLIDVARMSDMLIRFNIPILGIIENMSYFIYNNSKIYIFGKDSTKTLSEKLGIALLACIPIDPLISQIYNYNDPIILGKDFIKIYDNIAYSITCLF